MDKKTKKRAAAAAVTAVASAGVLVGGLFAAPADLLKDGTAENGAVIQTVVPGKSRETAAEAGGLRAGLRRRIMALPAAVRAAVVLPLWCVGWLVTGGLSLLWRAALSPLAGRLALWACLAAVLVAVFALAMKAAFPDLPLRKILCKRNLLLLGLTLLALAGADLWLPRVWDGYGRYAGALRLTATFLLALTAVALAVMRELRLRRRREKTRPLSQEEIRRRAAQLADSVR